MVAHVHANALGNECAKATLHNGDARMRLFFRTWPMATQAVVAEAKIRQRNTQMLCTQKQRLSIKRQRTEYYNWISAAILAKLNQLPLTPKQKSVVVHTATEHASSPLH